MYMVTSRIYRMIINEICETYAQAEDIARKTEQWGGTAEINEI